MERRIDAPLMVDNWQGDVGVLDYIERATEEGNKTSPTLNPTDLHPGNTSDGSKGK